MELKLKRYITKVNSILYIGSPDIEAYNLLGFDIRDIGYHAIDVLKLDKYVIIIAGQTDESGVKLFLLVFE